MRGDWDDVNRRLTSAIIALDLDDSLVVGDKQQVVRKGLFGGTRVVPVARREQFPDDISDNIIFI